MQAFSFSSGNTGRCSLGVPGLVAAAKGREPPHVSPGVNDLPCDCQAAWLCIIIGPVAAFLPLGSVPVLTADRLSACSPLLDAFLG